MACADALWRTYLEHRDLRKDPDGVYKKLVRFYPTKIAKLDKNTPFRMIHDGINHILPCSMLECWVEVSGTKSLEDFIEPKPAWTKLCRLSEDIYNKFVAGDYLMEELHYAKERGTCFENQIIFNRDALYYRVLSHAS